MKFIKLLLLLPLISFSQSMDLDRFYLKSAYVNLPTNPIENEANRTYSSNLNFSMPGFTRVRENGTIDVKYTFNGTTITDIDVITRKVENKDKDGNITSTKYYYKASAYFSSTASAIIYTTFDTRTDTKELNEQTKYESQEFDSYSRASKFFNDNKFSIRNEYSSSHKKSTKNRITSDLIGKYAYPVYSSEYQLLWLLGSSKNPEFEGHKNAYETLKNAFSKMDAHKPIDDIIAEVQPAIAYFESIIPKYPGTKKKDSKIKYASYYNIAKVYYLLDMPEKSKNYAQKLIDNDYDAKDGKSLISSADELLKLFEINKINTRHFEVTTKDLSGAPEEEKDTEGVASKLEVKKAYLITKSNDTSLVSINVTKPIDYEIELLEGENLKVINALDCSKILLTDGTIYKNINFVEAAASGKDKLAVLVYEAEPISLYRFKDEFILFNNSNQTGVSTFSTKFAFGFNKELSIYAEGCPKVQAKINDYQNNEESLISFCKDVEACKK